MKAPRTTLQALRAGKVRQRISHFAERRKVHRDVDAIYNTRVPGRRITAYAVVVVETEQGITYPRFSLVYENQAEMIAALRSIVRRLEANQDDHLGHEFEDPDTG